MGWFVAGTALAVVVGGWAAWQLSGSDEGVVAEGPEPSGSEPTAESRAASDASVATTEPDAGELLARPIDSGPRDVDEPGEVPAPREPVESGEIQLPAPNATVESLLEQSRAANRASDFAQAEVFARQALAISPQNAPAAYRLAVALFRLRRLDESLTWAIRASEWDPREPRYRSLQGDVHMRTGRFHAAARAYEGALEVSPGYTPAERMLERLRERGVGRDETPEAAEAPDEAPGE